MTDLGFRVRPPLTVILVVAALIATTAGLIVVSILLVAQPPPPRISPLTITACTPESYTPPVADEDGRWRPGTPQARCDRPFVAAGDAWPVTEPIPVEGQVCNSHPFDVSYVVRVDLTPVDRPDLGPFPLVADIPITYPPGCQAPYAVAWEIPELLRAIDDLGRWRAVGVAEPVDPDRYVTYQWDSFATVELVGDPGR